MGHISVSPFALKCVKNFLKFIFNSVENIAHVFAELKKKMSWNTSTKHDCIIQ